MECPKDKPWRSAKYLKWVRSQPCVITGMTAQVAHHITGTKQSGMGTKPGDEYAIPLIQEMHRLLHDDPLSWEERFGKQWDYLERIAGKAAKEGELEPFIYWRMGLGDET